MDGCGIHRSDKGAVEDKERTFSLCALLLKILKNDALSGWSDLLGYLLEMHCPFAEGHVVLPFILGSFHRVSVQGYKELRGAISGHAGLDASQRRSNSASG